MPSSPKKPESAVEEHCFQYLITTELGGGKLLDTSCFTVTGLSIGLVIEFGLASLASILAELLRTAFASINSSFLSWSTETLA